MAAFESDSHRRDEHSLLPKMHPGLLEELRPFLSRPIAAQRWRMWKIEIIAELHDRAEQSGSSAEEELLLVASTAAWIIPIGIKGV